MILRSLTVQNFRNLAPGGFEFHPAANLFLGDNGQGKTNLLEAIYFLATTRSFRTRSVASMMRLGSTNLFVQGRLDDRGVAKTVSIGLEIAGSHRRRQLLINEERVPLQRYVSVLQTFAYSAARLEIVRGGPDERRRFLDRGIASIDSTYLQNLSRYARALKQRNALLQKIATRQERESTLAPWDLELVSTALPIVVRRAAYTRELVDEAGAITAAHAYHVRDLDIVYQPSLSGATEEDALRQLRQARRRELAAGFTVIGPHRDNVDFTVHGHPAEEILSSGEIKMTVLFLKFAKMNLYRQRSDDPPLFLLDDVDAELDLGIIHRLMGYLAGTTQIFTTSAKEEVLRLLPLGPHATFLLRDGAIAAAR